MERIERERLWGKSTTGGKGERERKWDRDAGQSVQCMEILSSLRQGAEKGKSMKLWTNGFDIPNHSIMNDRVALSDPWSVREGQWQFHTPPWMHVLAWEWTHNHVTHDWCPGGWGLLTLIDVCLRLARLKPDTYVCIDSCLEPGKEPQDIRKRDLTQFHVSFIL